MQLRIRTYPSRVMCPARPCVTVTEGCLNAATTPAKDCDKERPAGFIRVSSDVTKEILEVAVVKSPPTDFIVGSINDPKLSIPAWHVRVRFECPRTGLLNLAGKRRPQY